MANFGVVGILVVSLLFSIANAIRCGGFECYGFNTYCCFTEEFENSCCYYSIYDYWWFWFLWILFLCFVGACGFWCCRRRRVGEGYYVIRSDVAQGYGTNWASTTTTTSTIPAFASPPPAYPANQYQTAPATAPLYQPPPAEKPPAYAP